MAITSNEKKLIAVAMFGGAIAIVFLLLMPAWDAMQGAVNAIQATEQEIGSVQAQLQQKKTELVGKQANQKLPEDINIRLFEPDTFDKNVKSMLDSIIKVAVKANNSLISLEPTIKVGDTTSKATGVISKETAVPSSAPGIPVAAPDASGVSTVPPGDPNAPPPPPGDPNNPAAVSAPIAMVGDQIQYFAYTMAIRGTFDSLMDFITDLDANDELIEITSIEMRNEVGAERVKSSSGSSDDGAGNQENEKPNVDPTKPIKLVVKMRLLLIPKPASTESSSAAAPGGLPSEATSDVPSVAIPGAPPSP